MQVCHRRSLRRGRSHRVAARAAIAVLVAGAGTFAVSGLSAGPVAAASPPPYTHSYYIETTSTSTMRTLGASEGSFDSGDGCRNVTNILDFGQVGYEASSSGYGGYGAYNFDSGANYPFVGDGAIGALVNSYAYGWYHAVGSCPHLELAVAVNNYHECPFGGACSISQAGSWWGSLISNIRSYLASAGESGKITVRAADDAEAGWDCYATSSNVQVTGAFLSGYNSNNPSSADLLDFGDAAVGSSCGYVSSTGSYLSGPAWSETQVYDAAYGQTADYPFPEAYYSGQISDWYDVYVNVGYMNFFGTLSQYPRGGYSPDQASTNFYNTLKPVDSTLVLESSSDSVYQ